MKMADDVHGDYRTDVFATDESKEELRSYMYGQVSNLDMEVETSEIIASSISLGGMYPTEDEMETASAAAVFNGPVQAVYDTDTEGSMVRLGKSTTLRSVSTSQSGHNGIWGYATGQREYALQCHGVGFAIIDVTDPGNNFRVQCVPMEGGGYWRDVATHFDSTSGKTFAYVGSQGTQGGGQNPNLFVFDLSYLSGDLNNPNDEDSDPIPENTGWLNVGYTGYTHTIILNASNNCVINVRNKVNWV